MQTLVALISAVLSAVLRTWLQQRGHTMEIEQRVRLEGALANSEATTRALLYKVRAVDDGDVSDDLGVRESTTRIDLPRDVAGVAEPTDDPSMHRDAPARNNPP
ncbi:MAG: hypothetical protein U0172_03410 [Nitrospiraceae bacterium]